MKICDKIKTGTIKAVLLALILVFSLNAEAHALGVLISAEEIDIVNVHNLSVRQDRLERSGVLISLPVEVDLNIWEIIRDKDIESIEDYAEWLSDNIQYKRDEEGDVWATAEETLDRGYGDCEDISFFNKAFLSVMGYEPKVLGMIGGLINKNHAICVFKKGNYYVWLDNTKLKYSTAESIEELASYLFRTYLCAKIVEIENNEHSSTAFAAENLRP